MKRMRKTILAAAVGTAVTLGTAGSGIALSSGAGADEIRSFRPLTTFSVPGGGVAEIIAVCRSGRTLVYTNSDAKNLGIVDISDPLVPQLVAEVALPGEPTSVAVTPDGSLAAVVVNTCYLEEKEKPRIQAGQLVFVDLAIQEVAASIAVGPGPDAIAIATVGDAVIAAIAIENEPVIVDSAGNLLDEEDPGHPGDISQPGVLELVEIDLHNPGASTVRTVSFRAADLAAAGLLYPDDPQPEFVDICRGKVAVTLQENNGVAVADARTGNVDAIFSLGRVIDRAADLTEDDRISFTEVYPGDVKGLEVAGIRCADAVAWNSDGTVLYTADEGEVDYTGGRGWSAWSCDGVFLWDDGGQLEREAVAGGHYPEGRSEAKGIEVEGVETGVFGSREFAFVGSERGSFVAVYDISIAARPRLLQLLPTGIGPEGLLAVPQRDLFLTSDEETGTLSIFQGVNYVYHASWMKPQLRSAGVYHPWAAISGLAADPNRDDVLYGVPDNALPSAIYRIELRQDGLALVSTLAPVMKCGVQQRYDLEGIAIDTSIDAPEIPGFWLASEGNATYGKPSYRPNLLVQVGADGEVMQEVALPTETDSADGGWIRKNGFEGVTVSSNGRYLLAAIQRGYADDTNADNYTRISRYDLVTETWDFFLYPLAESNLEGDWIGLSEIVNLDWDRYAVVERDKQIGGAIRLKSVYTFTLDGLNPFDGLLTSTSDVAGSVISKQELVDLRDLFSPFEKVEGLAVTRNGVLWAALDNDGGEVESVLCAAGLVPDLVQKLNR